MDCDSDDDGSGYEYFDNKFIALDRIVQSCFDKELITDIECRNVVFTDDVKDVRAAIYSVMCSKNLTTFQQILKVFRNNVHPLQSPKILGRIFSFLKFDDIANCRRVCGDWKSIVDLLMKSKYDEINMDQLLLDTLILQQKFIINPQTDYFRTKAGRQATVFTLCLGMKPDMDETLYDLLQTKSECQAMAIDNDMSADESYAVDDPRVDLIPKIMSHHTVLNTIFKFLSLKDIKCCRIVCRNWNSVAESFLRKLSVVQFHLSEEYRSPSLSSFMNISKYMPLPNLPFKAFKFNGDFPTYELTEFFSKLGKNVQNLHLYMQFGIRACLSQTVNLTELNLQGAVNNFSSKTTDADVMIPWSKLHSIKVLNLSNTLVKVDSDAEKEYRRIIPLKLSINNVRFFIDGTYPAEMTLNTFVDYSKVKDVHITGCSRQVQIFDWASETFDAERMTFANVQFVNASKSKSAVDHLKLYCTTPFSEKANMSVKQLLFEDGTVKLSALPQSLEKLGINVTNRRCVTDLDVTEQFQLPNLKYVSFRGGSMYNLLSHFDSCYNLTDLEIVRVNGLHIRWLPRSVKRLKLESRSGQVVLVGGDDESHELDLLVLNYIATRYVKDLNFDKLRPKVLVLQLRGYFDDKAIVAFLQRNKRIGKIYLQFMPAVASNLFDNSEFSRLVDKSSDYYEFSNERGRAITFEEFFKVKKFIDVKTAMKRFWNSDGEERHKKHKDKTYNADFHDDYDEMSDNSDNLSFADPDSLDEDSDDDSDDSHYW